MNFKLSGRCENLVSSGQGKSGAWYLYAIKTGGERKTKTWRVFTKESLTLGSSYTLEGFITESPNDRYKDQNGKPSYQTTYSANKVDISNDYEF